ncbi:hypothetical protein N8T08_000689 [Aspergillus melleus]|uniref:Uncharacterized protein n=1 Tax=Aspergillus melleus TaxID=138277 RepID=A0ACC3APP6_9EURO|nr:hypothetical protein N8T08_000689 [Aspergillus melleus]
MASLQQPFVSYFIAQNASQSQGTAAQVLTAVDDFIHSHSPSTLVLGAIFATTIAVSLHVVLKNSVLHPLRNVPGVWFAGLTSWYEFYFDVIRNGTYIHYWDDWHKSYNSSIIRVSPNHVHVNDPEFYKKLFAIGSPFRKARCFYHAFGLSSAIGSEWDPKTHHRHRAAMNPGFSPKSLASFTPTILRHTRGSMDDIAARGRKGMAIIVPRHAKSLTVDVVSEVTFGRPLGLIGSLDEEPIVLRDLSAFMSQFHMVKHIPAWRWLLTNIPGGLSKQLMPGYFDLREKALDCVNELIEERKNQNRSQEEYTEGAGFIFELLLRPNPKKGYKPPDAAAMVDEGCAFIVGGSDTTGFTIEAVTYTVLKYPGVFQRLREELDAASSIIKDDFDIHGILRLPWLSAVIKETMRLFTPTPGPLPREVPPEGVQVGPYFLPGGTIVSHSLQSLHHNPDIFPDPESFKPERWLGEQGTKLTEWWNPFSRGTRSCIGQYLALNEIHSFIAHLFLRFDLELFQTDERSVEWVEHMFTKFRDPIQVKVRKDRWAEL